MVPRDLWACVIVACLACSQYPPTLDAEGDPCNSVYDFCFDEDTLLSCEDRQLTQVSCDEFCARMGPSYVSQGCDGGCECVLADPNGCAPGTTSCVDETTISTCDEDQQLQTQSCVSVCAVQGLSSLGCMPEHEQLLGLIDPAECWCTHEGTPCEAEAPASCVDATTVANCVDGIWVFEACADVCGVAEASCDPWLTPQACIC